MRIIATKLSSDFTREVPPKFEIFADRIEITSAGTLSEGLSEADFFDGVSIPRNRELMRVYRDLELVEQLGSGVPRILESYGRECFRFMDNFIRMAFPATESVTPQVTPPQVERLLAVIKGEHNRQELQRLLGLSDRKNFRENYLNPAIEAGLVGLMDPDNPTSSKQQYMLTEAGKRFKSLIRS